MDSAVPGVYEFGEFRLDPRQQLLSNRDGTSLALNPRAFDLLAYLLAHPGELLEKSALLRAVWPNVVVDENNLSQHISTLRRVLGDGREGRRYIVTVAGRGYQFVGEVRSGDSARTVPPTRIVRDAPLAMDVTTPAGPRASVAVLPFANVSGDPDKEYFGDGMAEELIHLLSRVPGLKVPARTSSFAYKGKNVDVRQIGRDLGVATVLEGSVRSAGARLRITAQLIDARTGYHFLSQSFDRESGDIFQLQDEIAGAIVQSLMSHMKIELQPLTGRPPPTRNVEAYQLYLLALSIGVRGGDWTTHRAIELLGQAIALDPGFARALAVRAAMRIALIFYGHPDAVPQAEREARQALSLDSGLGEAHSALAMVCGVRRKWLAAEEHFQAAAASGGTDIFVYAAYLPACVGYRQRALEVLHEEFARAPASPLLAALLASASLGLPQSAGATPRAVHYSNLALDLGGTRESGPLPIVRLYCGARLGQAEVVHDAARTLEGRLNPELRVLGGAEVLRRVGVALTDAAQRDTAVSALCALTTSDPRLFGPELSVHVLAWLTMLGALDEAYAFATRILDHADQAETMGIFLAWIWIPELLAFRRDERFEGLALRLGLMEYWLARRPPDECELVEGRLIVHE